MSRLGKNPSEACESARAGVYRVGSRSGDETGQCLLVLLVKKLGKNIKKLERAGFVGTSGDREGRGGSRRSGAGRAIKNLGQRFHGVRGEGSSTPATRKDLQGRRLTGKEGWGINKGVPSFGGRKEEKHRVSLHF